MDKKIVHPAHPGALTADSLELLPIPCAICIVSPNTEHGLSFDWQMLLGWTKRQHAKLRHLSGVKDSSTKYEGRMVPYSELGLILNDSGKFSEVFCTQFLARYLYVPEEDVIQRHDELFDRLQTANPRVFFYHSSTLGVGEYPVPALQIKHSGTAGGFFACGFEEIEAHLSEVEAFCQEKAEAYFSLRE